MDNPPYERAMLAANQWANMATSGLLWLKGIRSGQYTLDQAIDNMEAQLEECSRPKGSNSNGPKV